MPDFTLSWTTARSEPAAGIATAIVNTGIFLGAGILQPLVGWVVDRGKMYCDPLHAWDRSLMVLAGAATAPLVAAMLPARTRAAA